jgi:hypothetical protein
MAEVVVNKTVEAAPIPQAEKTVPPEDDLLDLDIYVERPPARNIRTVEVEFVRTGYRPPKIVDNPED